MKNAAYIKRAYEGKAEWGYLSKGQRVRHAALGHEALGTSKVKVLFHDINGDEYAYWMDTETYRSIPLMTPSTPDDYRKYGVVVEAQNTDIYSLT